MKCSWLLTQPNNQPIEITFTKFELGNNCGTNFLIVYNGDVPTAPRIAKYCVNQIPVIIKSQGSNLLVEYHVSTESNVGGFNLTYRPVIGGM